MESQEHFSEQELGEYHLLVCKTLRYKGPSNALGSEVESEYPVMHAFLREVRNDSQRPTFLMESVWDDGSPLPILSNEEFLIILPDLVAGGLRNASDSIVLMTVVNRFVEISERSHDWLIVRAGLTDSFLDRLRKGLLKMIDHAWDGRRVSKRADSVNSAFD